MATVSHNSPFFESLNSDTKFTDLVSLKMPRPMGSLNKKGKQSIEERKERRKATSKPSSVESMKRQCSIRKAERMTNKIMKLSERIKQSRQALHAVGRFSSTSDPAFAEMHR